MNTTTELVAELRHENAYDSPLCANRLLDEAADLLEQQAARITGLEQRRDECYAAFSVLARFLGNHTLCTTDTFEMELVRQAIARMEELEKSGEDLAGDYLDMAKDLEERVEELQAFIREREFNDKAITDYDNEIIGYGCSSCGGTRGSVHSATCRKAALLAPLSGDEEGS